MSTVNSTFRSGAAVPYDYGDKKAKSDKVPKFNGDPEEFSWRPKVTAIEEAKDLNTLSVEDLVSSLKVHEIGLNEHEPARKVKSIAPPSKGKSSKAFKVIESEDESPEGDSDEDPTEKMTMLSNKLKYLAKKNRKFLSKKGG